MATLTESAGNKGVLKHAFSNDTQITMAGKHITSYIKLPNNILRVTSGSDLRRLKFIDEADREDAIVIIDAAMSTPGATGTGSL